LAWLVRLNATNSAVAEKPRDTRIRWISVIPSNNGHCAVQGHSKSPILVPMESPYTTVC